MSSGAEDVICVRICQIFTKKLILLTIDTCLKFLVPTGAANQVLDIKFVASIVTTKKNSTKHKCIQFLCQVHIKNKQEQLWWV